VIGEGVNVLTAIIEAMDLKKRYRGGIEAVKGVSFSVSQGEIFGFLGPNGAGKSTTIHMLITLIRPTSGRAQVAGWDIVTHPSRVRQSIGFVSQDIAVDDALTGRENLLLQARLYHLTREEAALRSREVLRMVELEDRADHLVSTYSGGMRKRLDIAEGLIHRPRVLFLDEPTLGLDIQTRRRIWDYIVRLRESENITVFLTTHYMEEADTLCDRVAIIDGGKIVASGTPGDLKAQVGGDMVTMRVSGDMSQAVAGLGALDFVERAEIDNGSLRLTVRDGETAVPQLLTAVVNLGQEVLSMSLRGPTLDDVFLHYTGRALRHDEGGDFLRTSMALKRARR